MKREELIKKLQLLPEGIEVCIFDVRLNESEATGDPCGTGIYKDFDIEVVNQVPRYKKAFATLTFETHDYNVQQLLNS